MQDCRIAATDLACQRGERVLFSGLAFDLEPGAALHIAGANGIGKSSLIRILAGLLRPLAGGVDRRGDIGLIDERPSLDPALPLGRALAFWQQLDGGFFAMASASDRLGLGELLDVPVRYLSTGQRKRAALVRLLDQQAALWLLDEPLNGLDAGAVSLVETLASDHCKAGGICIIASHQPFALPGMEELELKDFTP
jgi:heme exporter protein A